MSEDKFQYELSGDEFLEAFDVVIERVETPELKLGSYVHVRSLSAFDSGQIMADGAKFKEKVSAGREDPFARDFNVKFVYLGTCDSQGNRLFKDISAVAKLKQKNGAVIARIASRVQKLSGFSKQDLEQLEKNSVETQPDDSPIA